jgi:hypothetical protein
MCVKFSKPAWWSRRRIPRSTARPRSASTILYANVDLDDVARGKYDFEAIVLDLLRHPKSD